jgi:hypothetical protein
MAVQGPGDVVVRFPVASRLCGFRFEGLGPGTFALGFILGKCEVLYRVNCTEYQGWLGQPPNILSQEGTGAPGMLLATSSA